MSYWWDSFQNLQCSTNLVSSLSPFEFVVQNLMLPIVLLIICTKTHTSRATGQWNFHQQCERSLEDWPALAHWVIEEDGPRCGYCETRWSQCFHSMASVPHPRHSGTTRVQHVQNPTQTHNTQHTYPNLNPQLPLPSSPTVVNWTDNQRWHTFIHPVLDTNTATKKALAVLILDP